jgi:hypothetical protein
MRTIVLQFFLMLFLASGLPATAAPGNTTATEQVSVNRASIVYTTRAGDTLMSIAERFTARIDNWQTLSKANNIGSDTAIPIGTPITIPADLLQDEPSEARVIALSGSITASSQEGQPLLLGLGAKITEGMQIDTGNNSFLTLELPDQSRISLPSNSRIRVAKLRMARYTKSPRTEILLLNGKVESKVAPLEQNKGRFEVRTPMAVAGVRGTRFRVGVGANGMATEVLSGKVEVGRPNSHDGQHLNAGQGNITSARSVGKPVDLLPTPQLAGAPTRQDQNSAQFVLTPVPGAQSYHVQVATDQEAKNILLEGHAKDTRIKLDGLPNGSYYARVSAIDKLGLEGPASTHAFTLGSAPPPASGPAPSAPTAEAGESRQLALRWSGSPGQQFTVQVARDPAFSWLIYTTKTMVPEARFPRPPFGTYYARVQVNYPDGSASPYSLAQPFVVTDQWIIHEGNPVGPKSAVAR